jgi:uncharacterized membrane protein YgdD (TMEM256/DUF423 family)
MRLSRVSIIVAALLGALAVALGAFGAHSLRGVLDERALSTWHTAVDYQFWHALALLGCGVLARSQADGALRTATCACIVGSLLFCGSLYALALGAPRIVGIVTPFGGVALIIGWVALGIHAWRIRLP